MKTTKIFLSIAGFALTGICFGQLLSSKNTDNVFYTAYHKTISNGFEHWVDRYPARYSSGDHFEEPAIARTFYAFMDSEMGVEPWMTSPFETNVYEEDLQVESWMTSPFESSYDEMELSIEPWMTAPFDSGEDLKIEPWMTAPWI
jgi:hypothetical protein